MHNIPPIPEQEEFIVKLVELTKTGNAELLGRPKLSEREKKAKILIDNDMVRKMSLDLGLIDPNRYGDYVDNKASTVPPRFRSTTGGSISRKERSSCSATSALISPVNETLTRKSSANWWKTMAYPIRRYASFRKLRPTRLERRSSRE